MPCEQPYDAIGANCGWGLTQFRVQRPAYRAQTTAPRLQRPDFSAQRQICRSRCVGRNRPHHSRPVPAARDVQGHLNLHILGS